MTGSNLRGWPAPQGPVAEQQRLVALDVLRGVALLGILPVNIAAFALIEPAYLDPTAAGGFAGADRVVWWVTYLLFDQKMMTLFSLLFGAGLALQWRRAQRGDGRLAGLWYRRTLWLGVFGLAHAYLIWHGDILVGYAVCAAPLFLARKLRPGWLLLLGLVVLLVAPVVQAGLGLFLAHVRSNDRVEWESTLAEIRGTPAAHERERRIFGEGSWRAQMALRAGYAWALQSWGLGVHVFWRAGGLMLVGMALLAWGVLSGERGEQFYRRLCVAGYGLGLPLVALGAARQVASGFDVVQYFLVDAHFNYLGSLGVAGGHIGLVLLAVRARRVPRALAAVGRTAFSGYIGQSIVCTGLFYSWGLGWFGRLGRLELAGVVLGVWAVQLVLAPLWLARLRYGPIEWVWRCLTYWRIEPLRRDILGA